MLRRHWGILFAVAGLALGYPINESANAQTGAAENQAKAAENGPPRSAVAIENGFARVASAIEAAQANPNAQRSEQRAQNDLKAQQEMARWAFWMFFAAALTTLLSAVGVFLIWRTLYHTREASRYAGIMAFDGATAIAAAVEANNAMREANEIAREASAEAASAAVGQANLAARSADAAAAQVAVAQDTAKRELRAYVGVKEIGLSEIIRSRTHPNIVLSQEDRLHVTLKNYGKTPATITFHAAAQHGGEQPRPSSLAKPPGAPLILQPGQSIFRAFPVKEIKKGERRYFVILRIFYIDIYGVGHGHRIDYSTAKDKPTHRALHCDYEKESVHPPKQEDV